MYDTLIVLSQNRNHDGSLGWELTSRVDYGIGEYILGRVSSLTMSGHYGRQDAHLPTSQAEDMRNYAIEKGVPMGSIFLESTSIDTGGQAVFTMRDIIVPNNIGRAIIVTSDYHLTRTAAIFDFVFGDNIERLYASVTTALIKDPEIRMAQERSLVAFLRTFEGVERGNLEAIQERLFERHPLYIGKREEFGGI
ncbi:MAG: YdcF family protein [Nanoarchaeota archaeon]